jgi:ribonuclease P protein component
MTVFMLQRSERIKYSGLFTQAFQKGKKLYSKNLCLIYTKTREALKEHLPLTGFVIAKTYSKKAVLRNKIKRQLREIYRLYRMNSKNKSRLKEVGLLVIRVSTKTVVKDYKILEEELQSLLDQI